MTDTPKPPPCDDGIIRAIVPDGFDVWAFPDGDHGGVVIQVVLHGVRVPLICITGHAAIDLASVLNEAATSILGSSN